MNLAKILTGQSKTHLVEQSDFLVNKDIQVDLAALTEAAKQAGFELAIASSFRDFDRQLAIWNGKFTGILPLLDCKSEPLDIKTLSNDQKVVAILRWSALPGASRHHWGTDLDIFAVNLLPADTTLQLEPWEYLTGHQAPFYQWLKQNLHHFGFFFPYDQDRGGIAAEPWHISHIDCASQYQALLTPTLLIEALEQASIAGKQHIITMLPDLYPRFITNVGEPAPA